MNILVIGTGYVGTTTALVFAELGWNVTGLDSNAAKIEQLRQGHLPIYEPGLEELLRKHLQSGRIRFTTDKAQAFRANEVIFISVGTPSQPDGSADLRFVKQVAEDIGQGMNGYKLVVIKSTVPVGTQEQVTAWIQAAQQEDHPFDVASNPEFLREGKALTDALNPDRVIIGSTSSRAIEHLQTLYQSLSCPLVVTSPRTAELIKYASNAYLATKISYMNELAKLCDQLGVNVKEVANGIGLDHRIGPSFLHAGIGYGGSCFPKDVAALLRIAQENAVELGVLKQVEYVNQTQHLYMLGKARECLGTLADGTIALLGLAFKPDTDDIREAPAIRLIQSLLSEHAIIRLHDPVAKLPESLMHESVTVCPTPEDALKGADAVFLCTEWTQYRQLDWVRMKSLMNQPNLFDGRNLLDADHMKFIGYSYRGIGYE
ncbi:UDP-glucose/GDP-mannose dehydrogenase family protein [Paenibacillus sp. SI8]|uniref:UDP-glucose dehydrogenase family protein n=1 Tax=unclassified Paenibacillus TaxID=185978 RepID=UPI003465D7C9